MGIFDGVKKSREQERWDNILETSPKVMTGEKGRCKAMFEALWGPVDSPWPMSEVQAILDIAGSSAIQMFQVHSAWQDFIAVADPTYTRLVPPYKPNFNEDGTITLAEWPSE